MNFSILISVYFREQSYFLKQCLKSIWEEQSLKPSEIVLVKDGPLNEELENVIKEYISCAPLKVISLPKNMGLGIALREGLKYCSHEFVIRMDSDDISTPDRFEKQLAFMESNPQISAASGTVQEFINQPNDINKMASVLKTHSFIYNKLYFLQALIINSSISGSLTV